MAIYNIPIVWTRVGQSYDNNKVKQYDGTINLNIPSGNNIVGTWGAINGSGTIYQDESTQYWNVLELKAYLTQGTTVSSSYYDGGDGPFYPNRTYGFKFDMGFNLVSASNYSIKVEPYYNQFANLSLPSTLPLNITTLEAEKPFNFTKTGTSIYEDLSVNFTLNSLNYIDYQVVQDEVQVLNGTNVNTRKITIPKGTLKNNNSVSVKVRSRFEFQGTTVYSDWVTYGISALVGFNAPEIDNLRYVGATKVIEEPMTIAWGNVGEVTGSVIKPTIELWQDGYLIYNKTFSGTQHIIPSGTVKSTNTVTVKVYNTATYLTYTAKSSVKELSLSGFTSIAPVITDFTLDGLNRDYDITIVPTCVNADKYRVNGRDGLIIPKGTLVSGSNIIILDAIKLTSDSREIVSTYIKTYIITQDMPQIYSLEPDRVNVNVDQDVPITFVTNDFCYRWELQINGGSIIRGTTDRKHIVAGGTLNRGNNTLKLIAYYIAEWGDSERKVEKIVEFNGFGRPETPTLDPVTVYNSAVPVYRWGDGLQESDSQVGFQVQIVDNANDNVIENKISDTNNKEYKSTISLTNNKTYKLRVRIKNKYNLWSYYAEKLFETSFNELPKPSVRLDTNNDTVLVSVNGVMPTNFTEVCIFRKSEYENEFVQVANKIMLNSSVVDYTIPANTNVSYKARIYDNTGSYSESDIITTKVYLPNYKLSNVENFNDNISLKFATASYFYTTNEVIKHFKNANDPVVFSDNSRSISVSIDAELSDMELFNLEQLLSRSKILCFRDRRGRKYYVYAKINSAEPVNSRNQKITMSLVKVNFIEKNMYCTDGFKRLVFLNGEYFLDGTINMSGFEV